MRKVGKVGMMDRKNVIKGLQIERECVSRDCDRDCGKCDLVQEREWLLSVYDDAIALLKKQEAVEPIYIENSYTHLPVSYCPKCREPVDQYITGNPYRKTEYCHYCGQAVKWNDD
jgi:hypothetical protein